MAPISRKSKKSPRSKPFARQKCQYKRSTSKYELASIIGYGGFSEVYLATNKETEKKKYAIKVNLSTCPVLRISDQLRFLIKVDGHPSFPKLIDAFTENGHVYIVQEYFPAQAFSAILRVATLADAKHYLFELLKALKALKDKKICHRDIKPQNFLYNMEAKKGILIDFGLASNFYQCGKGKIPFHLKQQVAGTRQFAPFELFFNYPYTYASEIWSVGVIMLKFMTGKERLFNDYQGVKGHYNYFTMLMLELSLLNKKKLILQCDAWGYGLTLPSGLRPHTFSEICKIEGYDAVAEDLMTRMLDFDPETRISVQQAMEHQFFTSIKTVSECFQSSQHAEHSSRLGD